MVPNTISKACLKYKKLEALDEFAVEDLLSLTKNNDMWAIITNTFSIRKHLHKEIKGFTVYRKNTK